MKLLSVCLALVFCALAHAQTPPVFVSQPSNVSTSDGGSFTVNVQVNTSNFSDVSWRATFGGRTVSASSYSSATTNNFVTASILFGPVSFADTGSFQVIATNPYGSTPSAARTLTVTASPPSITAQPASQTVAIASNATFTVGVSGTSPFTYQWRKDGAIISGATNATLSIANVQTTSAGNYTVTVTNSVSSVTSNSARLSAALPPAITAQPSNQTVVAGAPVSFAVTVTGTGPLSYEWRKDGNAIAGATSDTLSLSNIQTANAGRYTVVVSNAAGSITSSTAILVVSVPNPARLINLSILTSLASSGESFTIGYVVGGIGTSGEKPLVIRAAGPSLGALGVPGTLADPRIDLFVGATPSGSNDNWGGAISVSEAMARVGAFPFIGLNSRDSAVLATISTRDNSVKVSGVGSSTGAVIAEVYDATPADRFTLSTPRLINCSVLKHLGSGMTAGFVIAGEGSKTVLIRAVGPGLSTFGIPGVVFDPALTLYGPNSARVVAINDNWDASTVTSVTASVGAFNLPAGSRDAAVVVTLTSGDYTVEVKGAGGVTGNVLVEIYEVP